MRYYIYISDAKVDMLLSQIPHEQRTKIATELKLDFKLLSASRKVESEVDNSRITRLGAVVAFIREYGNLGTVDSPDEYVEDSLTMRWGPYGRDSFISEPTPLVYFGGLTSKTILGLGGSAKHVLGNAGESAPFSASATPYLLSYLAKHLDITSSALAGVPQYEDMSLMAVHLATMTMKGPEQPFIFMAKRLLHGPSPYPERDPHPGMNVLLASPLYVALEQ